MPNIDYMADASDVQELLATRAATATVSGTGIATTNYQGKMMVVLDAALGTGTAPTLNVTIETSADNSTNWTQIYAFPTQVTGAAGAGIQRKALEAGLSKGYVRATATIAGTSPSFNFAVLLAANKHY